jgi:hypothetical protein
VNPKGSQKKAGENFPIIIVVTINDFVEGGVISAPGLYDKQVYLYYFVILI